MDDLRARIAHYPAQADRYLCGLRRYPPCVPAPPEMPRCVICRDLLGEPLASLTTDAVIEVLAG